MSMHVASIGTLLDAAVQARPESWRYSRNAVRALGRQAFVDADDALAPDAALLDAIDLPSTRGHRLVFVNGQYSPQYSDDSVLRGSGSGVAIRQADAANLRLDIDADAHVALHLVWINVASAQAARWQGSYVLRLGANADVTLVEQQLGGCGADMFGRLQADTELDPGARLRATCLTDLADSTSLWHSGCCTLGRGARYDAVVAYAGGRLQRIETRIDLAATDAACSRRGVFALRGRQHLDIDLDVRHAAGDTRSELFWRGVADQRARGILHGAITVAQGSDGADAQLQTKNLLLSPHAEIDAQPVLEIYADEVKAAHGASVGQLDEQALFYLRSRGVDAECARRMLIAAFCGEVYAEIADAELRARFESLLAGRLPAQTTESS